MSRRALQLLIILVVLCGGETPPSAAQAAALERGTAITDPLALRQLDHFRFGIGWMVLPERSSDSPLANAVLFSLASMAPVRTALDAEFDRYLARYTAASPDQSIGVGAGFAVQLFDRSLIYSSDTRFVLAGIVNRMDRSYVSEGSCGEIRLIYRLMRIGARSGDDKSGGDNEASPRLPMTLNLVLKAKPEGALDHSGSAVSCADIAGRWLATSTLSQTGAPLARQLLGAEGPLDLVDYRNIDRIETNIQIAFTPKSAAHDFRTDYLLKVFKYNPDRRVFEEAPLENQIDRDRILADQDLGRELRAWLLEPEHFRDLDRGTVLIPEKFLARAALAPTPAGFDPSPLQPEFGLMQGEGGDRAGAVFTEHDVVGALKQAAERGMNLINIRSVAGFQRRLNDITCAGCHQTRGIGGFHFPGVDWMVDKPSNSTIVPASPHFFGDQVRRRDTLTAFRDGKQPDFSRGFSSRPQTRGSRELAGTEYQDGWGASCYLQPSGSAGADRSFGSWNCAEGLACQVQGKASRMGMCFVGTR